MIFQRAGHGGGKAVPVHRQRSSRRQLVAVRGTHDQRAGAAHFLMQQSDCIVEGVIGTEGVGTDQLGERISLMGERRLCGAHLVEMHRHARFGCLPGRFRSRQAAADNVQIGRHGAGL